MRYLLALLILFLTTADIYGWTLSLAPGLSVKNAIIYLIVLGLGARFVVRGGMRMELPQVQLWFAVLIAYAMITWLVAGMLIEYKSYALLSSGINLKASLLDGVILFELYFYGAQSLRDARSLLKCTLLAVAVANLIAIGNSADLFHIGVTTVGVEGGLAGRVYGAFGHANETAALIVYLLPGYVAVALCSRGTTRVLWAFAGVASAILLIMTGSRGGFMALALTAVLGSYMCRDLISWRRAVALALTLAAIALPVLALGGFKFGGIFTHRVMEMIQNPGTSSGDRTYIWMPVVDKMLANPVTLISGYGWDVYNVMGFHYEAHNYYLLLWFELGVIGLISFLMVIRGLVITAHRAAANADDETVRYMIAFIYGILALLGAIFFSLLYKPWLYIWAYAGLTMRMAVLAMRASRPSALTERRDLPTIASSPKVAYLNSRRLTNVRR